MTWSGHAIASVSRIVIAGVGHVKAARTHRKTVEGRLCAAVYVHEHRAHSDCTTVANPDGIEKDVNGAT